MNVLSRSLVLLAIAGHLGVTMTDAMARPGGGASGGSASGHGGPSGAPGGPGAGSGHGNAAHGQSASVGHNSVNGIYGGQQGVNGISGIGISGEGHYGYGEGHQGPTGNSVSTSTFGGGPPVFFYPPTLSGPPAFNGFTADASSACGYDLQVYDPGDFADTVDRVATISQQTQSYIGSCGCHTQTCVADALDKYADALETAMTPPPPQQPSPYFTPTPPRKLPKAIRDLPKIVHEAAAKVRAAKTPHAAEAAVHAAIELVHKTAEKTISLMRASDPDAKVAVTRSADLISDTLTSAATALIRPDAL